MITTATIKSRSPDNDCTKIALSIYGDTKFPLIFLKDEKSALQIFHQLMAAELNEENISEIEIDGIIHSWNRNIKMAVDEALCEWFGDLLDTKALKR